MGFWSKFAKALNIGAKVAEVAAPVVAIKDPELAKEVKTVAGVVDAVIPEESPQEDAKRAPE